MSTASGISFERRFSRLPRLAVCSATVCAAILLGRLSWFSEPYGISVDESTYMALGDIVVRGGVPYHDALDRKPPGLFWLFAAMARGFGPWNIHAVHAMAFTATLLLCGAAAWLSRGLASVSGLACWGAILFALYSACMTREIIAFNAEYPMLIGCAGAVICLGASRPGEPLWRSAVLAGAAAAAAALAALFKQYALLVYGPMALVWFAMHGRADLAAGRAPWPRLATTGLAAALGLIVVFGGVALWFWHAGALAELSHWALLDGFLYMRAGWRSSSLRLEALLTVAALALAWLPLWLGIKRPGPWRRNPTFVLLVAGGLGAAATTFLSGRSFAHYYLPLAWFASILAAPGLRDLWSARRYRLAIAGTAIVPLALFVAFNTDRDAFWPGSKFNRARQAQLAAAAAWIRGHVAADETIAVWGAASQLYPMSGRGSATRDVFADFVSGRQPGFDSGMRHPMPGALADYLSDLERNRPAVIADTSPAAINDYGSFPLAGIPELERYVRRHYCRAASVGGIDLWGRLQDPALAGECHAREGVGSPRAGPPAPGIPAGTLAPR